MTSQIADIKTIIIPLIKQHQAIRAGLFGSLVRGEMKPESDIDILVELPAHKSLLEIVGLKLDLEQALGKSVDLVEYSTIPDNLMEQILAEEIPLIGRDSRLFLQDILESINLIEEYTQDLSQNEFSQNIQVQDAVIRRLEIIGEATKNLPRSLRLQYPAVPWQQMAGMRDILIHGYFGANLNRIWEVIEQNLPVLQPQITQILDELQN
jgi:uncharacterized protein with HEPN domain/predicted nucleotidyltransferase